MRAVLERAEVRYLLVAGAAQGFYLLAMAIGVARGLHYGWAMAAAHVMTIALAFPAYRRWAFGSSNPWPSDLWRFVVVWFSGAALGLVGTPLLVELGGWHPVLAQGTVMLVAAVGSFLSHRHVTFGER